MAVSQLSFGIGLALEAFFGMATNALAKSQPQPPATKKPRVDSGGSGQDAAASGATAAAPGALVAVSDADRPPDLANAVASMLKMATPDAHTRFLEEWARKMKTYVDTALPPVFG